MASSRLLLFVFLCSILFHFVALTIAQNQFLDAICLDKKGKYSTNSNYQKNLNNLLSSLSSTTQIHSGFYKASLGKKPDTVNAMALCRGDVKPDACQSCIKSSAKEISKRCPNQIESFIWYDYCMLRYSNRSFFRNKEPVPYFWAYNTINVKNVNYFSKKLYDLLHDLKDKAASGGSGIKFATGNATIPKSQTIYALAQCTPDLSKKQCSECLSDLSDLLPECCTGRQGGRVVSPSCNFRYEINRFYG